MWSSIGCVFQFTRSPSTASFLSNYFPLAFPFFVFSDGLRRRRYDRWYAKRGFMRNRNLSTLVKSAVTYRQEILCSCGPRETRPRAASDRRRNTTPHGAFVVLCWGCPWGRRVWARAATFFRGRWGTTNSVRGIFELQFKFANLQRSSLRRIAEQVKADKSRGRATVTVPGWNASCFP